MSVEKLLAIVSPGNDEVTPAQSEQQGLFELLKEQQQRGPLLLYGSSFNHGSLLVHSVLVPEEDLEKIEASDLASWDGNAYDSWTCGLVWGGGQPPRVEFDTPTIRLGKRALKGTQLVFGRSFEGRAQDKNYYEIAQFLTHAHRLHWVPERHAWCRFDEHGDVEDVIRWTREEGRGGYGTATCIEINRETIEMHMSATGTALVQMFDSNCAPKGFQMWGRGEDRYIQDAQQSLYYHLHTEGPRGSYVRGVHIIRPRRTAQQFGQYLYDRDNAPKQYESFITHDFKNNRIAVVSCDPKAIASYFEKDSPLPFHMSPVYFKAAVLDKYKADPEKYSLEHRSISCRNSWHLPTYDVNEAGQVHTYIKYLGDLPYFEQVYWKAFNEHPRASISKRAFATDFEGSWDVQPDSLRELQSLLSTLHASEVKWFKLREPDLVKQIHYPLTNSVKAWGDTLSTLAKLVIEGLHKKFFEQKAKGLGSTGDVKWGSIRWAQEALKASGFDEEVITEVIKPLHDLQMLRTKLDAHAGGAEAITLRTKLLTEHQSPRGHIEYLCRQLVHSLQVLRQLDNS